MIKNIIFDMGNVVIRFDPQLFIRRLGIESGEDNRLLMREVFQSVEWAQLDRGIMSESRALSRMYTRLPERLHSAAATLVGMWDRPILPVDGMYELLEELQQAGYALFLLSNASGRQHEYWERVPAAKFFCDTLISADVKLVKPQPEIFDLALDRFRVKADESLFIDDSAPNCEGAVLRGIDSIVFHGDTSELRRKLNEKGVPVRTA